MIDAVEGYLEMRRYLRYKDEDLARDLRAFARDASNAGHIYIDTTFALTWASRCKGPFGRKILLYNIRALGLYLRAEDERHEVIPTLYCEPRQSYCKLPYIYDPEEIAAIMNWLLNERGVPRTDAKAYRTVIGLLAATGMRVSEALALDVSDVREDYLPVKSGKFNKERRVYIDQTTAFALQEYIMERSKRLDCAALFVSSHNKRLGQQALNVHFRRCTVALGLLGDSATGSPRIHDLRHTFAVRSLAECKFDRQAVMHHIVALSVHLGHVSMRSTYWYLRTSFKMKRGIVNAMEAHDA